MPAETGAGLVPKVSAQTVRDRLKRALSLCHGNKSAAAKWLGISRGTLYKELRRAGLDSYIR
jgi:transcriptional regulator of acetoin/glycerol metabolism